MSEIEALRAAMRGAVVSGKGQYIEAGQHELTLDKAFFKRSQQGGKVKESYIFEFKVDKSSNPTHEVGSTRSYVENMANDGALERIKPCLAAIVGVDPYGVISPADQDLIADIIAALRYDEYRVQKNWPVDFLKGRRVACEGMPGTSRKGTPITNKKWSPLAAAPAPSGAAQ